jgi:hypothetical protein
VQEARAAGRLASAPLDVAVQSEFWPGQAKEARQAGAQGLSWLEPAPGKAPAVRERRGRPKGARSRLNREWSRYIIERYGSPLEALAEVVHAGPKQLAAELGVSLAEGFEYWKDAAIHVLPYLHPKLATLDVSAAVVGNTSLQAMHLLAVQAVDEPSVTTLAVEPGVAEAPADPAASCLDDRSAAE